MTTLVIVIWSLLAVLAVLNITVCVFVIRSEYYSRGQKFAQCLVVWLLPVIGPLLVGVFLYGQRDNPLYNTRAYPEPSDKGVWATVEPVIHNAEGHGGAEH